MNEVFRFAAPQVFVLLLGLPWLYMRIVGRGVRGLPFPMLAVARAADQGMGRALRHLVAFVLCAGCAFLIVGLARPQGGTHRVIRETEGIDIIVAVDTSGSMAAMDFSVGGRPANRLDAAAQVFRDFIARRNGDRIGIVAFGEVAWTQVPLTADLGALQEAVRAWRVGMAGENKTAIGDAIAIATRRLKDLEAPSKVIILLTDGKSNAGTVPPLDAAEAAQALGVRIYTIGVGTHGTGLRGLRGVEFDEDTLMAIADRTDGAYFRVTDTGTLEDVIATIDSLEVTKAEFVDVTRYQERYRAPVMFGVLLLMVGFTASWLGLEPLP